MAQLDPDQYRQLTSWNSTYGESNGLYHDVTNDTIVVVLNDAVIATLDSSGILADLQYASEARGDITRRGASAWERHAAATAGQILLGDGTDIVSTAVTGDVTINSSGVTAIGASKVVNAMIGALAVDTAEIAANAVTEAKVVDSAGVGGLFPAKYAIGLYDFSTDGGTEGAIVLTDVTTIPDNAVCELVSYDVLTTCTSSSDAATIKLDVATDGDLSTAIAISDGSNPWDAGVHLGSVVTPLALKTTAARALRITVAGGEDLTAGKVAFCVRYWVSS